jgi:hypothetical protein
MKNWVFNEPPNAVVFAHRTIVEQIKPILIFGKYLDGSFCAYTGEEVVDAEREIACIALSHIVEFDPTVCELADIPPGWWAVRESSESPWRREEIPEEEL